MGDTTPTEVRDFVMARLDLDYTRAVAAEVAASVRDGDPIGVNWQPGDGTRYSLMIVPLPERLRLALGRTFPDGKQWEAEPLFGRQNLDGSIRPHQAVVSLIGAGGTGGAHALDLSSGGFVGPYVSELYDVGAGSGAALAILLDLIAEALA